MEDRVDQKIKSILADLEEAHRRAEKFYAKKRTLGQKVQPSNFYEQNLAFDNEKGLLIDLDLALAEKYPEDYTSQEKNFLRRERDRLTRRIHAWQNDQFPSRD